MPQADQLFIKGIYRIRIPYFVMRIDRIFIGVHRYPRFRRRVFCRKAGIPGAVPLHWGARVVAAHGRQPCKHLSVC